jgi:probable RNA-binding protein EIF1AD
MGRPKRDILATAQESSTPPATLSVNQFIARVVKAAGNNLYAVESSSGETMLVELPSRFRSTIWIKRGGYVLVDTTAFTERDNKIAGEIANVVRDEKQWRKESYWYVLAEGR